MKQAESNRFYGEKTIVFVDEIHRFNKAQQDAFLPFVEKGSITLIGATTENPSFEVNGALLSRCKVFVLKQLEKDEIVRLLHRAIDNPKGFGAKSIIVEENLIEAIAVQGCRSGAAARGPAARAGLGAGGGQPHRVTRALLRPVLRGEGREARRQGRGHRGGHGPRGVLCAVLQRGHGTLRGACHLP